MSKIILVLILFVLIGSGSFADPKPFKRAVILTGGSFNAAAYIGVYDSLIENGKSPDLIISTCGTTIATAIIKAFPNEDDRINFLRSREFHKLMRQATVNFLPRLYPMTIINLLNIKIREHLWQTYPDVFYGTLYNVPESFGSQPIQIPFKTDYPRTVIVASKLSFGPRSPGFPVLGNKVYQETYFTDSDTAQYLKNFKSPVALQFPKSEIAEQTDVLTNYNLDVAARASISDPYLINPIKIDGHYYLTGAIDHYPIEIAQRLADEIIEVMPSSMGAIGEDALKTVFGFDINKRRSSVLSKFADYWIDFTNYEYNGSGVGFGDLKYGMSINPAVPEDYDDFVKGVMSQYALGHYRADESLASKVKNSKRHFREI